MEYIPDIEKEFFWEPYSQVYCLGLIKERAKISILEDSTWESIKKHIDVKLSKEAKYCGLCETPISGPRVSCVQ